MNLAQKHSIDLSKYEVRNIVVKDRSFGSFFIIFFMLMTSIIFLIAGIHIKNEIFISTIIFICALFFFVTHLICIFDMILFKIEYNNNNIQYRKNFKKVNFYVYDIKYFRIQESKLIYMIELCVKNKIYKYNISVLNKSNFIFILNLLKMNIEEK